MKRLSLVLMLVFTGIGALLAQRTITGQVSDENGEGLIGATVLVKGTTVGTVTDIDGNYTVQVPADANTLVFSYTGFVSQEIELGAANTLDVTMTTDVIGLEDVVVVGYSTQRKKDITGSVSSVSGDDIGTEAGVGLQTALRGRAAGVQVFQASGTPGAAINVRVRGSTSINASNQPLFVIDGVPLIQGNFQQVGVGGQTLNALADLNPNDIESIEVLKDASTAAIYGNRAANGVVLITTKKGSAGRTKLNFDASYGTSEPIRLVELMSAEQYMEQMNVLFGDPNALAGGMGGNTDWYGEVFRNAPVQNYNLSASGGDAKTRFYAGLTYGDEQGIVKNTRFQRYSGRLNLDHVASDKLTLGVTMGYNYSKNRRVRNDNNIFGAVSVATLWPATVPVYNDNGSFASAFGWDNPLATVTLYDNLVTTNRLTSTFFARYELLEGLTFQAKVGVDALDMREDVHQPSALQSSNNGTVQLGQTRDNRWLTEFTLNFNKYFGKSSLTALVGAGYQEDQVRQDFSQVDDFPTDDFRGLTAGATPTSITGSFTGDRLDSYFANVNYAFDDKYILTATFRADGSTRFINDKWGYFPGASVAWRLSSEPFLSGSGIDDLKLRVGWGITGNNSVGNFAARQLIGGGNNYADLPGIAPTQLGNPDLSWETTSQLNIGLDFAILKSRLSGSIDVYDKNTTDLLLNRPIPTTSGFTSVTENIGEVSNKGVELSLTILPVVNPGNGFNWELTGNVSFNKNEIVKLYQGTPIDVGFATRLAEGHPIGAFFGHVTDGIFQNQAEVEAHATQPGAAPGDFRYLDISGGPGPDGILGTADDLPPDGVINDNDRTFIGQGLPDWVGGLTNIFSFKGLELNTFFQFTLGNDIYNNNLEFSEGMHSVFNTTKRAWEGRWQQEGDDEDFPRAVANDPNNNRRNSTRNVENGSFLRLKTASLSYTFPKSFLDGVNMQSLRVYVSGTNLITVTDYSWFDPEVSTFGESNTAPGTDFLTMPQGRTISFGINVGF
ncbi:MAG: TonB-dependent receptor [Saprospiraceae bacterium]|nr:TonB-dependent receptor [Lewinella sp.]